MVLENLSASGIGGRWPRWAMAPMLTKPRAVRYRIPQPSCPSPRGCQQRRRQPWKCGREPKPHLTSGTGRLRRKAERCSHNASRTWQRSSVRQALSAHVQCARHQSAVPLLTPGLGSHDLISLILATFLPGSQRRLRARMAVLPSLIGATIYFSNKGGPNRKIGT